MHRTLIPLASAAALLAGGPAMAQQVPADPAIAVLGGVLFPDVPRADDDLVYGIELSANCQFIQPAQGRVRHHLSVTRYNDSPLKMTSAELNSHYTVDVAPDLALGVGPGIGYARTDIGRDDHGLWSFQVGGSMHYRTTGNLFLGLEARYQFTESARFEGRSRDADNLRILGKAGFHF
jgi:hypothetical protein